MKLFKLANRYIQESDWRALAALKLCLLSIGLIVGVLLPASCRTAVLIVSGVVFVATYIPLMAKFFRLMRK
ncbi:MAG: permease of phosphate ABC transporter [Aristaeellaceae bacterium]